VDNERQKAKGEKERKIRVESPLFAGTTVIKLPGGQFLGGASLKGWQRGHG